MNVMRTKKCIAMLLAVALLFQCGVFAPIPVKAVSSAQASGRLNIGDAAIDYLQDLQDNGDGSFSLSLTFTSPFSRYAENTNSLVSRNGYYVSPATGDYLIQLWGGKGADGGVSNDDLAGDGGAAGYVYGIVHLEKGQTLFYQLGGNGQSSSNHGVGGGANGPGGHAGSDVRGPVGGGGGYSAVYLYDVGEFESAYLDDEGKLITDSISEEDRKSKHLMIAGGGGGGGNSSAGTLVTDKKTRPSGGAGGSFSSALSGTTADGGTYFAGADGQTSGTSTERIGLGGAIEPGAIRESLLSSWGLTDLAGVQPNNWAATVDTGMPGGMGGAGNLRGGGGGAGYAGGSGGLQSEFFLHINVGGGGGGSSYISSAVTRLTTDQESQYLTVTNNSKTGGCIQITAITQDSTTSLSDLSLDFTISEYFDVTAISLDGVAMDPQTDSVYNLTGLNITEGNKVIDLTLKPKYGFAGGNGVPLLGSNLAFTAGSATASMALHSDCARVNVPLNFKAMPVNQMTNAAGTQFALTELYNDNVSSIKLSDWQYAFIENVTAYSVTDTSGNAVGKEITDGEGNVIKVVAPTQTTSYYVSFTVTPKSGATALVGAVVKQTEFKATATITVLTPGTGSLGGNSVTYKKSLTEDSGIYTLTLSADISSEAFAPSQIGTTEYTSNGSFTVPVSGYYFIQAWGADGARGGNNNRNTGGIGGYGAYLEGYTYLSAGDVITITTGTMGDPGSDVGYADANGGAGGTATKIVATVKDGNTTQTATLFIAGGGGGGGGARWGFISGNNGLGRTETYSKLTNELATMLLNGKIMGDTQYSVISNQNGIVEDADGTKLASYVDDDFNGSRGSAGDGDNVHKDNAKAGNAGLSYINTKYIRAYDDMTASVADFDIDDYRGVVPVLSGDVVNDQNMMAGAVHITCLQVDNTTQGSVLENYSYLARIARYWDVLDWTVTDTSQETHVVIDESDYTATSKTETSETFMECTFVELSGINPNFTTTTKTETVGGEDYTKTVYTAGFTIAIQLKPKSDFVGGNDVLILKPDNSGAEMALLYGMQLRQVAPSNGMTDTDFLNINVAGQEATDKANVPINIASLGTLAATDLSKRTINQTTVTSIAPGSMFTWTYPNEVDFDALTNEENKDWRYEFVKVKRSVVQKGGSTELYGEGNITPNPLVTTMYTVSVGLEPLNSSPTAVVVSAVSPLTISLDVEIIVVPRIKYELANLTTSVDTVEVGGSIYHTIIDSTQDHVAVLTPQSGYVLPAGVKAYSSPAKTDEVPISYNTTTGKITIEAEYLIGTVCVVAKAEEKTYSFTVHRQTAYGSETYETLETYTKEYAAVQTIDYTGLPPTSENPPAIPGYDFVWELVGYGTEMANWPTQMPAANLRLYGRYVPKTYNITVNYEDQSGSALIASETYEVTHGQAFVLPSKTIDNYVVYEAYLDGAKQDTTQSVTIDPVTGDATVTFKYKSTQGSVYIVYQYPDGSQAAPTHAIEGATVGSAYTVPSPSITGYTPYIVSGSDKTQANTVTGTIPDGGAMVYVTYLPNTYKVTLDAGSGVVGPDTLYVEYNNKYNYYSTTADGTKTVQSFPTPVWQYHTFQGWYIDANGNNTCDSDETVITGESAVAISADTVLKANWTADEGKVIIVFVDEAGNKLAADVIFNGKIGTSGTYDVVAKGMQQINVDGEIFTTETTSVPYTFRAEDQLFKVKYISSNKTYRLTINYWDADNKPLWPSYTANLKKGDYYAVESPEVSGYELMNASQTTISGYMGADHVTITVYYTLKEVQEVISVTVSWGDLDFDYDYGTWNPQTHQYDNSGATPQVAGGNTIQVSNNSTVPVDVILSYENKDGFNSLKGHYTAADNQYGTPITTNQTLARDTSQTFYFWLTGTLDSSWQGSTDIPVGTCTVTIDKTGG